jgi:hypothetical protein
MKTRIYYSKLAIIICALFIIPTIHDLYANESTGYSISGYWRKDGTYVKPHIRTFPDQTNSNNYSTEGNINPKTGKEGTISVRKLNKDKN